MTHIYFIEGPVGAGKSTYAKALASKENCTHIALDEWFVRLFSPDRPEENAVTWYMNCKDRLIQLILHYARAVLESKHSIILELGLIQRAQRMKVFHTLQKAGIDFSIHVLDAPKNIRRERVQRRNEERGASFSMVVPDPIFEIASHMWEPPDEMEIQAFNFVFPQ